LGSSVRLGASRQWFLLEAEPDIRLLVSATRAFPED